MGKINSKKYIIISAVIGLLIFLHIIKILTPIENITVRLFNPILGSLYKISSNLRNTYKEQTNKRDMAKLAEGLEEKIEELTVQNAKLKVIEEENQILREILKFSKRTDASFLLSHIVSQEATNEVSKSRTIIIDKGASDGLRKGQGVITGNGILVGKIISVKDNLSEVCLITDSSCKLAAMVQNQDKTSGIGEGDSGLTIKINFIPQTEIINIGDTVVTSGLDNNIPRGLVIGKVSKVNKENNELWQNAVIQPLINLDNLIIVSVILP
ncbi:rod shape-determining protein MreC [Candidatus Falkowbacteria bacterium CG_4_9_14_3_um_filter_36_9]|uniref:Cell shape-determining protein MreC n=2 Tax=Candidatus Falkowiibacteriota TaxID=1752728 RepID=A0A1J4TCW2_9BACT|nr:MAG: rod shape-determining protein MreC [Candidatus Falkowbacteria bacterium CG1_02_37_44]PIV52125.1 MAG: rod shape-determining protein MreC [Candidatus Falkowbacteria bacterium CG02_land_8_20_14_3_00_36_14]PIX11456.1 MAG: rod shape-determining protein MreC [Candidatus Falkowbacteria bacterium CG_4_8_14_3_um_filter_36_11]PJA11071.1 MAG: rod shape-determining protein MreC [Candidatus Falkowbacteria bacterium CG_4_10_14_0_2_um_filter_36_22]PJB19633.1 MAG: rod shape-determining protein MreC [Ca